MHQKHHLKLIKSHLITRDRSNTYIWLVVIFSLEIQNLLLKFSQLIKENYINT